MSDVAPRRVVHWREGHIGTKVGASKVLKQFRRAALGDASMAMHDDVLVEADLVACAGLNGQRDPRVAANVSDLAVLRQVGGDDLIAI